MAAEFIASSGVPELDELFGGLYWGDNLVWAVDAPGAADPFYAAVARTAADYHLSAFVTLTRSPAEVAGVYPGFEVLDARPGTPLEDPDGLLAAIRERCRLGTVAAQLPADGRRRPPHLGGDGPHTGPGQAQVGDLQPLLHTEVPPRRFGPLARDLPAGRLAPTPPGSSIHSDNITGRLQRRA